MEHKKIVKYLENYLLLIPIYYDHETEPAWRKATRGTLEEVQRAAETAPDYMRATEEENRNNRQWKYKEMLLLAETGHKAKAEAIKAQYHF